MKKYLLILLASLFSIACTEQSKEQEQNVKGRIVLKKEEYKKPVNTAYDSISEGYKLVQSFDSINFMMGFIQPGSKSFICLDKTILMKDSLLTIPSGTILNIGDSVSIDYFINSEYNHENWSEPIYKVKVSREGKKYEGYLPQSNIAIAVERLDDNNILMVRIADMIMRNEMEEIFIQN